MTAAVLREVGRSEVKWEEEFRIILKETVYLEYKCSTGIPELYNQESIAPRTGQVYKGAICKSCISNKETVLW